MTVAEKTPTVEELMKQLPPGPPPPDPSLLVKGSLVFSPKADVTDLRNWSQWWTFTPGGNGAGERDTLVAPSYGDLAVPSEKPGGAPDGTGDDV